MTDLLSLTKIGNIKLGKVINGNPLALEKMLVTRATKENAENFQPYPGFSKEGEDSLTVTLPFDSVALNFEVNYISFIEVDKVEYIAKAPKIGDSILLYPLNPEDFGKKIIDFGKLTEKDIEMYEFKYTGFLKVMIPEVSNFGEVFYFKTGSINTIRAITDQLTITKTILNDKLTKIPLELKPVKKDLADGTQVVFLSIGINDKTIYDYIENRKDLDDMFDFESFDKLYYKSREQEEEDIVKIDKKAKITLLKNNTKEVISLENANDKLNSTLDKEDVSEDVDRDIIKKYAEGRQVAILVKYLAFLKGKEEKYLEVFSENMENGLKPFQMLQEIG